PDRPPVRPAAGGDPARGGRQAQGPRHHRQPALRNPAQPPHRRRGRRPRLRGARLVRPPRPRRHVEEPRLQAQRRRQPRPVRPRHQLAHARPRRRPRRQYPGSIRALHPQRSGEVGEPDARGRDQGRIIRAVRRNASGREMKPRALVIGGSLGGLFAANLLHDLGWELDVYERVPDDLASRGAGIGTHEELLSVLGKLGIAMEERLGAQVGDRICLDREGRIVHRVPWGHIMSGWANVYRPLKVRFPAQRYHFGKSFEELERRGSEVVARFSDGSEARADLLIGDHGLRSAVRGRLFPALEPAYAGYVAWRALVDEHALGQDLRQRLGNTYWFGLPPGEMIVAYPVPARDGAR